MDHVGSRQPTEDWFGADSGFFSVILDNLPVAIFAKDISDNYRFVIWNKKQEEITTITKQQALHHTDFDLFSEESASYFREIDQGIVASGKQINIPEEIIETSGGETFVRTMKVPVTRGDRTILIGISEDITDRVKGRQQLESLNRDLVEKNAELESTQMQLIQAEKMESVGRLAAGVAHEVKNPLALLLQGVEYLDNGIEPGDPNVQFILTEMMEAIHRADTIVKGLVDFSSNHQIRRKPICPVNLMERVLLMVRHEINRNSVVIRKHYAPTPGVIFVDEHKFEQVLINILMNSFHALSNSDRPTIDIIISTTLAEVERNEGARSSTHIRSGDRIFTLEIIDNGSGVDDSNLSKIFDPFFTTKATGVGTGLGLSVVRKIVELHNGEIALGNRTDGINGACTQICLPAHEQPSELYNQS